jgi:hypothetical protein
MSRKVNLKISLVISTIVLCIIQAAPAGTIYVDINATGNNSGASWKHAYLKLQDAILNSVSGDQILVAQGTYKTGTNRMAVFYMKNGVEILGGYAGNLESDPGVRDIDTYKTILTGDLNGDDGPGFSNYEDNAYHVVNSNYTDATAVLDGFTITGGNANGPYPECYGGGLHNKGGSPTIRNCTFSYNKTSVGGGAMYNFLSTSAPLLINCIFRSNRAVTGGAINNSGTPTLVNCLLSGNSADSAGAIQSSNSAVLINCTISSNSALTGDGGGMYCLGNVPTLTNCIFWANTDIDGTDESSQIYMYTGIPVINYSCVQGWTGSFGGTGNIGDNPYFVDIDGPDNIAGTPDDNLRLFPASTCIDTADNSAVPGYITTDLDGNPRIENGTVDMGSYEGPNQGFVLSTEALDVPEGGTAAFNITLAMEPLSVVEVTVAYESGDTDISVQTGNSFTFDSSNYAIPYEVTLAATEDSDYHHGSTLIWISAPDIPTAGVTATELDNEPVPTVLFVDKTAPGTNDGTSWTNAFTNLVDAFDTASVFTEVQQIYIAEGTYTPSGTREAAFEIRNNLAVYGGFPIGGSVLADRNPAVYPTILSGDLNGDDGLDFSNNGDNSFHVITGEDLDSTAVIDGLIIKAGNANGFDSNAKGGALYFLGNPQITNCTFTENFAVESGGGIHNESGNPVLTGCSFNANTAGDQGGGMSSSGNLTLIDCVFTNNSTENTYSNGAGLYNAGNSSMNNCTFEQNNSSGNGGGIYNYMLFSHTTLTNCTFTANTADDDGGGLYNRHSDLTLTNCRFISNSAVNGGGAMCNWLESTQTLVNCLFNNNSATFGGAISNSSSSIYETSIVNCTLTANMAPNGNAIACEDSSSTFSIVNSILFNGGDEIFNTNGSTVTPSYCDIHTGPTGDGNISTDPMFIDADGADDIPGNSDDILHLAEGSPCIDAGRNTHPFVESTDILGGPRFIDDPTTVDTGMPSAPIVDMGAYEFALPGDMQSDADVDLADFAEFAPLWFEIDCNEDNKWCNRADFDYSGDITAEDLESFIDNWLVKPTL